MSAARKAYARPCVFSAPVPLVEELLAVGYRKKAARWADHARARREALATSSPNGVQRER